MSSVLLVLTLASGNFMPKKKNHFLLHAIFKGYSQFSFSKLLHDVLFPLNKYNTYLVHNWKCTHFKLNVNWNLE